MTKLDRLGGALQEVEAPLGRALREYSPFKGLIDSDLQLTYSQCAIATAALQLHLVEQGGFVTYRRKASLPLITPDHRHDDPVQHIVLNTDDKRIICPTYTQFFELVGLSTPLAQQFPDMKTLLPKRKIALFHDTENLRFGRSVAREALRIREKVRPVLATRALNFHVSGPPLLQYADDATVFAAYQSIWDPQVYAPFTVEAQAVMHEDDRFEACIRDIVDAI